jgi:1-phosphatidylinositol-4-phosphate 5-kinase
MDYSLLTGIHYLKRGNSENIRDQFLSVFEPNAETLSRRPMSSNMKAANLSSLKLAIAQAEAVQGLSSSGFPDENPAERRGCVFYQDDGGFLSTDEQNRPLLELYYVGIIDILTPYNTSKAVEHHWKSLNHDKNLISAVNPIRYGHRFLEFMLTHVVNQK